MLKLIPPKLNKGDTIGIVSPSGPVRDLQYYNRGIDYLKSKGYAIIESPHSLTRYYHMSATGKDKADDINDMFVNPKIKAIFPTVGGHTASQLIEYLDFNIIRNNPKIFFGFSDNSILINAIYKKTGLVCFHSLCDIMFGFGVFGQGKLETDGVYTSNHMFDVITKAEPNGSVPQLSPWKILQPGIAEGTLIGGNLSTLRSLIGTKYEPDWNNSILFLEDSAEPHQWDQQMGHLSLAGILDKINGLIIGKVEKPDKFYPENCQPLQDIFLRYCDSKKIPVIYSADFGHNVENCTLPVGIKVKVNCVRQAVVHLLESAVK